MQLPPICTVALSLFIHRMLLRAVKAFSTHWMPGPLPPIDAWLPTMVLNSSRLLLLADSCRFIPPTALGLGLLTLPTDPLPEKMLPTMTTVELVTPRPPPLFDSMCDRVSVSEPLLTLIAGT